MRRPLVYITAWALSAVVIVAVSWLGIRSALGAAVPARVAPLSPADLHRAVPSASPTSPSPSPSPSQSSSLPAAMPASPSPSPPATETWTPTPDARGGAGYRRTFKTPGGDAVVICAKGDARIIDAAPKTGWSASIRQESDEVASVTFTLTGQRNRFTRVTIGWANGPVAEYVEAFPPPRS